MKKVIQSHLFWLYDRAFFEGRTCRLGNNKDAIMSDHERAWADELIGLTTSAIMKLVRKEKRG